MSESSLNVTLLYFMSASLRGITRHIKAPRLNWRWKEARKGGGGGREAVQDAHTLIFFIR